MSLQWSEKSAKPRFDIAASNINTFNGEDAIKLSNAFLVPLHEWQGHVLTCWLAENSKNKYVHQTCGLIVPRQNGKTQLLAARILFGLLFANDYQGEIINYSAHRVDATLEMFNILVDAFGDPRKPSYTWEHPELHKRLKQITFTNGRQKIVTNNGGQVTFAARSTGSGRGSSLDVQIYDEAGFLTNDQLSAMLPTQSAAKHKNLQTIYVGTPPSEHGIYAEPFAQTRASALAKKKGMCWHEWSVEEVGDISDLDRIKACNPSYGKNLLPQAVQNELAQFSVDKFAIERLCWWPETASSKAINPQKWEKTIYKPCDDKFSALTLGVKFDVHGERVCVCVCAKNGETHHIELIHDETTFNGVQWLVDWLVERKTRYAAIYIDGHAGAVDLAQRIVRGGWVRKAVKVMRSSEVVTAATTFIAALSDEKLTHYPDDGLDRAAKTAKKRRIGGDGFGFGGDSEPLEAAAAALLANIETKRNPERKLRIG